MSHTVDLEIPVGADLLVVARLTASAVATRAGFDVEEIDDLRLAVDELCLPLVRARPDGRLHLRFAVDGSSVEISCTVVVDPVGAGDDGGSGEGGATGAHPDDALSARILDALVDEHGFSGDGTRARHWLRKQRTSPAV